MSIRKVAMVACVGSLIEGMIPLPPHSARQALKLSRGHAELEDSGVRLRSDPSAPTSSSSSTPPAAFWPEPVWRFPRLGVTALLTPSLPAFRLPRGHGLRRPLLQSVQGGARPSADVRERRVGG